MGLLSWLRGDDIPAGLERRDYSIGDPALAQYLGLGGSGYTGVPVNETSSMGLTALYRAVSLIAGSIAGLPLKSYRNLPDGSRERVGSVLDNPHGPEGMTAFEWTELVLVHLLLHGNAYLVHEYGGAGQLLALHPVHPVAVSVKAVETADERDRYAPWRKYFVVSLANGEKRDFSPADLTHIPAMGTDGLRGLAPIEAHRNAIGSGLAGDKAAARMFGSGMLLGGLVSGDPDMPQEEAEAAMAALKAKTSGTDHAGDIAWINANVTFTPWSVPARDAQFIESRVHQVEEIGRIYGIPPHLLGQTEKQTSWGTGVAEQNRGLARYTLMGWTTRIEQRLTRLLPAPRFCEFDYAGFLQPAPEQEIPLLVAQVKARILTVNEARAIRNMGPVDGGDDLAAEEPASAPVVEVP